MREGYLDRIDWKQEVKDFAFLILGSFIYAFAYHVLYVPTNLSMGGASGLANVLVTITGGTIPFGIFSILINVPILILGWKEFGFKMVYRSIIGTIIFSFGIDLTGILMSDWYVNFISALDTMPDLLIFAIIAGIFGGLGIGIILKGSYTTGGTDIIAVVAANRFDQISVGGFTAIVDFIVIVIANIAYFILGVGNAYQSLMLAIYSFVGLYFTGKLTDMVLIGKTTQSSQALHIVTDQYEKISSVIMKEMDRGVTGLKAQGMYTQRDKMVLYVVVDSREVNDVRAIVDQYDSEAFIIVNEVKDVSGEGFTRAKQVESIYEEEK